MAPKLLLTVLGTVVDGLSLLNTVDSGHAFAVETPPRKAWNRDVLAMDDAPIISPIDNWYNEWHLCDSKAISNLDGKGPDQVEEKSIRYKKVGKGMTPEGKKIKYDLVVTADSDYYPNDQSMNGIGMGGCFGIINLQMGKHVDLLFAFYESGTNNPVALQQVFFTVFDLDTNKEGEGVEAVTFNRRAFTVYYQSDHAFDVSGELKSDAGLTVTANEPGTGGDNPKHPGQLSPKQQRRTAMAEYRGKAMFKIRFSLTGGTKGGRNFAFSTKTNLGPDGPPEKTTTQKAIANAEATTTKCTSSSCVVYADPHVSGFDNSDNQGPAYLALIDAQESGWIREVSHSFDQRPLDVNALDTGDFWLVKSKSVLVQARYRLSGEFKPDRAAVGAVAVGGAFLNGHVLLVEPLDGSITLDGVELQMLNGTYTHRDGLVIRHDPGSNDLRAELPLQVHLDFKRFAKHIDVKITMPKLEGGVDGECGNYDGIAENDEENDIAGRMGSLIVTDSERLFATKFDDAQVAMKNDNKAVTEVDEVDVQASSGPPSWKKRLAKIMKSFGR